jgi:N-methylhydantoinase B
MAVTVTITDDEMVVDWSESATDVRGPINLPRGMTEAFNCLIFKSLTTPDWPVTAGNFRPLRIITKEGSLMHAVPPMPTFTLWPGLLGGEVLLRALSQGLPDFVPACSGGDVCSIMALGERSDTGAPWLEATNDAVGFGAHASDDGEDGIMHLTEPGCRNNPVEVLEVKGPMLLEHYRFRPDSGGPGQHRGGVGISRRYRFLEPTTAISILYKTVSPPWAIGEGSEGDPNHVVINPGPDQVVTGGSYNILDADSVVENNTGGGGGWGDPFRRDPARVADDVRNGFVSVEAARSAYGVALDPQSNIVDEAETATLRADGGANRSGSS